MIDRVDSVRALSEAQRNHLVISLGLPPQQVRVVEQVLEGKPDKHIARQLGISFGTVRAHLSRAFARTGASGRAELAAIVHAQLLAMHQQKDEPKC